MSKVCCAHDEVENHNHKHENSFSVQPYIPVIISFTLLLTGIICDFTKSPELFQNEYFRLIWYSLAYILVGFPVIKSAFDLLKKKDFFNEFSLMTLATLGAFALKEYPEGGAVMLFYNLGELFQSAAVNKARNNIKTLLDVRPKEVTVFRNNQWKTLSPEEVEIGEKIQIKAGEKVALDGVLLSDFPRFNTSALSGESKP